MRKTLLLSAALFGLASTSFAVGAHAQAAPSSPSGLATAPAVAAPDATTPAEKMPAKRARMHRPMHHAAKSKASTRTSSSSADEGIRPGHEPGVGDSYPASAQASNASPADTRSRIAPRLPAPAGGQNASIPMLLRDAQTALNNRQTGRAQESMERAETAMLQRVVPADQASTPDQAPDVVQLETARKSLASGDMAGAKRAIAAAMTPGAN